jgi:protein tyrosine/serine phosphatase
MQMRSAVDRRWKRPVGLVVLLLVAVATISLTWDTEYCSVKDHFIPRRFATVVPGALFRSGQIDPGLIEKVLAKHKIEVVVDLTAAVADCPEQAAEQRAVDRLGVEYHRFPLRGDGTGDVARYCDAVATIARAQASARPILVHCQAGDKRSGGVVAAYLLLFRGASAGDAMAQLGLFNQKHVASSTVVDYLNAHLAEIAASLRKGGLAVASAEELPRLVGGG